LYGWEKWALREKDKYTITSAEMTFVRRGPQCTRQDYKTSDVSSRFRINPHERKIQNYTNKWIKQVRRKGRDRQIATLNYKISVCGKRN
jgi:hypothetical protein